MFFSRLLTWQYQHMPLFLLALVVAVAGAAVEEGPGRAGAPVAACTALTMVAAASVWGRRPLRMISCEIRDFPNSTKKSLLLLLLFLFQEESTAVNRMKALYADMSMRLKKRTCGHLRVFLLQL